MFRAGLTLLRRLISAALLLILLICGAEVGVRIYEVTTGTMLCSSFDVGCNDPSKLVVPSWTCFQELKPISVAHVTSRDHDADVEIRTNSLGLRGSEPANPKPDDVCRIVVLGDETVFAPETPDSEHFCTRLQKLLQDQTRMRIEVINAGIPGHCPLSEFLLYKLQLPSLKPDLVLMHFDWSDVYDDRQLRRYTKTNQSNVAQVCSHPKLDVPKKFQKCEIWRRQFRLVDLMLGKLSSDWKQQLAHQRAASRETDTNPYSWLRNENPENDVAFQLAIQPIQHLAQYCQTTHIPFALMTTPKPWQVSARCSRGVGVRLAAGVARDACYSNRAPFDALAGFAKEENIPFIDLSNVLASGRDAETNFLKHAPRWSSQGHKRVADSVAAFLIENVPGAWNSPYFQAVEEPATTRASGNRTIQWMHGERHQDNNNFNRIPDR